MKAIQRKQSGFTLIELMIVIAIVAILVALALPAYRDFTVRTKMAECIDAGAPIKLNVAEHYDSVGDTPPDSSSAGVPAGSSVYCLPINYADGGAVGGSYEVAGDVTTIKSGASGNIKATFTPYVNSGGGLDWGCHNSGDSDNAKYLPAPCRAAAAAAPG